MKFALFNEAFGSVSDDLPFLLVLAQVLSPDSGVPGVLGRSSLGRVWELGPSSAGEGLESGGATERHLNLPWP